MFARILQQHQTELSASRDALERIHDTVASKGDLSLLQAFALYCLARDLRPDVIVELGRGTGNSTAVFAQALHDARKGVLHSFCLSDHWQSVTEPRLSAFSDRAWFAPIRLYTQDLTAFDFTAIIDPASTVLLFWDAHGFDIADHVLGHIMPKLRGKRHIVLCHDISDRRLLSRESRQYDGKRPWRGMGAFYENPNQTCYLWTDWACSIVDQVLPIFDFCHRNAIELHSVDWEFRRDSPNAAGQLASLNLSGPSTFSLAWFSLNESSEEPTFPPDALLAPAESTAQAGRQA